MDMIYRITKPFSINPQSLYSTRPGAMLNFNPGEIDEILYCSLAKGYPQYVERVPKNELVAAVWRARGRA